MQTFNKNLFFNYTPSFATMSKAMLVTEKLGKLNVRLKGIFYNYKMPSRIFAFVESKYSSKIEGIYTTLFDVVNTGIETSQQKIIKPLIDELFKSKDIITHEKILNLSGVLNNEKNQADRYKEIFGVYEIKNNENKKIYEPPKDKKIINSLLKEVIEKAKSDINIVDILHTHIMFEKVHPFIDANGRIGRLILQKSLSRLMNFANVLPLSWSFFKQRSNYYSVFDINSAKDLDKAIQKLLDLILHMYQATKELSIKLKVFIKKYLSIVKATSNKVTDELALDILLNLQTKRVYIQRKYELNSRTIDSIFIKLNKILPFNFKKANRNVLYWNIELEEIIDSIYSD